MVAAYQPEPRPGTVAEDLRKQVIRLLQANGDEARGTILVLPQVFLEFLDFDHKMALFLNNLLYWQSRTKNPDRWIYRTFAGWYQELGFKESVVRRLLYGDPRARTRKRTLTDIGVECVVKRAPNGSPTCHFRINLEVFLAAIRQFLDGKQVISRAAEPAQCTGSRIGIPADPTRAVPALEALPCAETSDQATTTQISPEGIPSESSCTVTRDDDLQIFFSYEPRFGKLKERLHEPFRAELTRLGATKIQEVLERCATRGRSWSYVTKALANESASALPPDRPIEPRWGTFLTLDGEKASPHQQMPESALRAVSERLLTPWHGFSAHGTVQDAWSAAFGQLELQLDQASFERWLRGATLVDFEPETHTFVVVARNQYACTMLQGRLDRMIRRLLSDIYGQPVVLRYLLKEEWRGESAQPIA